VLGKTLNDLFWEEWRWKGADLLLMKDVKES
jgi:hypothetical protein